MAGRQGQQGPYPEQFRREAVALYRSSGRSLKQIAEEIGVSSESLRTWAKQQAIDAGQRDDGLTSDERSELVRLRKDNRRLEQERDLLKRAAAFFAKETETR